MSLFVANYSYVCKLLSLCHFSLQTNTVCGHKFCFLNDFSRLWKFINIINNWHLLVFLFYFFCKFVNKYYLGEAGYRNKKRNSLPYHGGKYHLKEFSHDPP